MSRCFPYRSSGYSSNRDRNGALIESIKLQREREKAKAESRKGRKRGIKEKRRENNVSGKPHVNEFVYDEKRKFNEEKIHKWKKDTVDLRGRYIQKTKEDETEQLERSGLTEEHKQPVCPKDSCYSADSSQNINKRKRQASPVIGIPPHGNIIRIRLQPQKHKDPCVAASEERACSTSGRTETTGKQNSGIGHGPTQEEFCPTSVKTDVCARGFTPSSIKEQSCSTSGGTRISTRHNSWTTYASTSSENGIWGLASLYKDLVKNWVSPLLSMEEQSDVDELEWLFQRKQGPDREESSIASSDVLCGTGSSTLWPRAQYLPEAGLYALPFTVPF